MSTRDDIRERCREQSATSFLAKVGKAIWRWRLERVAMQSRTAMRMAMDARDQRDALLDEWEDGNG